MKKCHLLLLTIALASTAAQSQDAISLFLEGKKLKDEKKASEAIAKFEKAIELNPNYTDARYELAWCQNDTKNYTSALSNLRRVRSEWQPTLRVFFEMGWAFEKLALYDSAIASYKRALEMKPSYGSAHRQLGYIAYAKNEVTQGLEHFKNYEAAVDSITDYLYWYRKGYLQNANKDYSGAVVSMEKSMRYKPDYMNTFLEMGYAKYKLKNDDEAIALYKKAIELDPKSHIGYNGIGEIYRDSKKNMTEAMAWYKKSLDLNSSERKACFGMGYCLNNQGKYSEAIPYLRKAIDSEPTYTAAYVELGYSFYKTSFYSDAITNLNKAVSLNPANENARYYLTLLYISQKNKTMAQQTVDELKKLNSKHVATLQPQVNSL
jgi:tetratricopeptide (TPR) repeat protein